MPAEYIFHSNVLLSTNEQQENDDEYSLTELGTYIGSNHIQTSEIERVM